MRKIGSITFVVSCLLILSLSSCGNLVTKNTGAIVITLPGAEAARDAGPSKDDLRSAQFEIVITALDNDGEPIKKTASGGDTVVIDNLITGKYKVKISVILSNGLYYGTSQEDVIVKEGKATTAAIDMERSLQFWNTNGKLEFKLDRLNQDGDSFEDLYLLGTNGIAIKPNRDGGVDYQHWTGCWPFVSDDSITFYLTGTFGGLWHDDLNNQISFDIPSSMLNKSEQISSAEGYWGIPNLTTYKATHPVADTDNKTLSWSINNFLPAFNYDSQNVWCELQLWLGEDTDHGQWLDGTIFKYGDTSWTESEFNKMMNSSMDIDAFVWYDHITTCTYYNDNGNKKYQNLVSTELTGKSWFVIAQLINKPNGDGSQYQIVFPGVQSVDAN